MTEWTDSAEVALLTVPDLSQFQPAAQRTDVYLQTAACSRRIPVDRNHPKEKGQLQKVWKINTQSQLSNQGVDKHFSELKLSSMTSQTYLSRYPFTSPSNPR